MNSATGNACANGGGQTGGTATPGTATAQSEANDSPGVVSGNTVQVPVDVPVNVCGNTVDVVGLLNPATGNACPNGRTGGSATSGTATGRSETSDSPGVVSGNGIQLPVHHPVNVSGNSVGVVGVSHPVQGNTSVSTPGDQPSTDHPRAHHPATHRPQAPARSHHPAPRSPHLVAPPTASLAHTGTDMTVPALAGSAAFLLGGAILYRRFRPMRRH
ncbi:chaplin [Streptomyces sp. NK08204]|uniref:chaplin n=1 Tax=Streptomyces sp. NK08204 TaxID=2873260 RepID=UPI0035A96DF2